MSSASKRLLAACTVTFLLVTTVSYAQDTAGNPSKVQIKPILLRSGGWTAEYIGPNGIGVMELVFEDREGKIIAKINSTSINMTCERSVDIVADAVKMDACYSTGITLRYDPNDAAYPFKGENETVTYKLKPK